MARKNLGEAEVIAGHVLDVLATLPEESVSCVVTSPPYWSLRKYDAPDVVWPGNDPDCEHEWADVDVDGEGYTGTARWQHTENGRGEEQPAAKRLRDPVTREARPEAWSTELGAHGTCTRCGAWRGQFGLEPTPELYVEHTLQVLAAIKRVLRPDGCVYWNIGDGYSSGGSGQQSEASLRGEHLHSANSGSQAMPPYRGLPPKNLVLMPFRVALAAQADGWWVRSVIVWSKPNAMPESTKDRPTTAHEYILLLTKSARYWWDAEAVREAYTESTIGRFSQPTIMQQQGGAKQADPLGPYQGGGNANKSHKIAQSLANHPTQGRNLRSVWEFPTAQTPEAHFATFPEELPRRCIEASCPREICAKCGTARVRVVETDTPQHEGYDRTEQPPKAGRLAEKRDRLRVQGRDHDNPFERESTGWTSCDCAEPDYQSGIVLDPFCGIGTTGVVAKRLGRRFIGIELSEKYAGMARDKLRFFWKKTNLSEPKLRPGQSKLPLG